MSAYVRVVDEQDWPILRKYLDADGVVLVSKDVAEKFMKQGAGSVDGRYLDGNDFGGDADKFVDIVTSEGHYAAERILIDL